MLKLGMRSRIGTRSMRRQAFLEIVLPPGHVRPEHVNAWAADLEPLFGHDIADQPSIAMKQLSALRAFDASDRLHEIVGIPTLVVSAEHDPIAPPNNGRSLAAGIADSRYVEVAEASHGVTIQCPAEINALLEQHIEQAEHGVVRR
jgi:pimeloyl-ACP methyl ester carboxylesterase